MGARSTTPICCETFAFFWATDFPIWREITAAHFSLAFFTDFYACGNGMQQRRFSISCYPVTDDGKCGKYVFEGHGADYRRCCYVVNSEGVDRGVKL